MLLLKEVGNFFRDCSLKKIIERFQLIEKSSTRNKLFSNGITWAETKIVRKRADDIMTKLNPIMNLKIKEEYMLPFN